MYWRERACTPLNCTEESINMQHAPLRIDKYTVVREIGRGTGGVVYLCTDEGDDGPKFAIKSINRERIKRLGVEKYTKQELRLQRKLNHENILPIIDVLISPHHIYVVTPYCEQGDLEDVLSRRRITGTPDADDEWAKCIIRQVALAIQHCHSRGISHRDIKCVNVFLTADNVVKLGDFGFSTECTKNNMRLSIVGTVHYVAPEVLLRCPYNPMRADIYSFGALIYRILADRTVGGDGDSDGYESICVEWESSDDYSIKSEEEEEEIIRNGRHVSGEWIAIFPEHVCKSARELVMSMIYIDPLMRPSIDDVLAHPWLN